MADPIEHHDILVLGAGLSGINTGRVLRQQLPHRPFTILEGQEGIGGTWRFFRYPGFRSDSFMTSFGLSWYPWRHKHRMAQAHEIVEYLEEAVDVAGLRDKIRLRHKVVGCEWRTEEQQWRIEVDVEGQRKTMVANFVISCLGYYSYDKAFEAAIPGLKGFGGQTVHPQWWPEDLDYSGKRVVVIGSGATAITIVPELAQKASKLTMLQRSPSFVSSRANTSSIDSFLHFFLPWSWAYWLIYWKDVLWELFITQVLLNFPEQGRKSIMQSMKEALPKDVDVNVHFNPSYNPFQQRLCLCPEGDFFKAFHRDNCEIVTDVIETVTKDGILLKSGRKLEADVIITATGLYFQLFGGVTPLVDGQPIDAGAQYTWRGCMIESLPNMAFVMGYVTTSWTPGANIMAKTITRILKQMEKTGSTSVMPVMENREGKPRELAMSATSNYLVKAADRMPKVTGETPWYGRVNLAVDWWAYWFGSVTDGLLYSGGQSKKDA
ncbi:monooxygenase [Fusarium albosuccineum]|uniref:Monooxygenase n=1 Tax=Fusarium albosuccineum TaxID=1237068 RepID=A0A8H4P9W8_9HYPO|nr:monooxygenase [Fusarium albosuccineum]